MARDRVVATSAGTVSPSPRVGVDLTTSSRRRTGLEHYALTLTDAVLRERSDLQFVIFTSSEPGAWDPPEHDGTLVVRSPWGSKVLENQVWLARQVWRHRVDLMHYPAYPPLFPATRFVMTIHDLTAWRFPKAMSLKGYVYFRSMLRFWAPRSSAVLTVSTSVREEVARYLGLPRSRISVVSPGPRLSLLTDAPQSDMYHLQSFGLAPGYVLHVGTMEPRKNLAVLVEAVAKAADTGLGLRLVLVGRQGWGMNRLHDAICRFGLQRSVVLLGHVTDPELAALYRGARFLVQASIYEGFGLPLVEAMALGCPVIASDIPAHREVLGDAGEYFDPLDSDALAKKMQALSSEHARASLIAKGQARTARFTWPEAAKRVIELYRMCLTTGPSRG